MIKRLLLITIAVALNAQSGPEVCRPRFTPPSYPQDALEKRIAGSVLADVRVDASSSLAQLKMTGDPILTAPAERAVRMAKFDNNCRNRQFAMQFNFVLDSAAPAISTTAPIQYDIAGSTQPIVVTIERPASKVRGFFSKLWCW